MRRRAKQRLSLLLLLMPALAVASSWPDTPLPSNTQTSDVAQHIVFNGLDMHAQVFSSQQSQQEIVAYYRKQWAPNVVVNQMGSTEVVGHRDGDYYTTVQVSAVGGGSKGNIGIIDTSSAPKHPTLGSGLPAPMGAKVYNDILYPDDPVPARTVAMRDTLSPAQNTSYFSDHLVADGWKPAQTAACGEGPCIQRFERGDSQLTLLVTRIGEGQSQVIMNVLKP